MPTPKTWTDRAADILLDERNKRYLGMTEPTAAKAALIAHLREPDTQSRAEFEADVQAAADPSGLRAAAERVVSESAFTEGGSPTTYASDAAVKALRAALAATPPALHNEGSCELCTGQHDAEEAAFMNRKRTLLADEPAHDHAACDECSRLEEYHFLRGRGLSDAEARGTAWPENPEPTPPASEDER